MGKRNKEVYIPLHEAARVYGYTRDHLGYLIRKGELRGQKLGSFSSSVNNSGKPSSGKSLSPYLTTHEWVKEYLIKSGKARKKASHIKQYISSSITSKKQRQHLSAEQAGSNLKKELLPLWQDLIKIFNKLKKHFSYGLNSAYFLLKDIEKQVRAWQVEAKYLIKRTRKKTAHSKIINNTIESIGQGIDLIVFLPKESIYQSRQLLIKAKSVFLHQLASISVALKKVQREILWKVSVRSAKNKRNNFSLNVLFSKINPKLIGSLILLIGLTLSSFGIYISSLNISEPFNTAQTKLANVLDKISLPVYIAINNSDELAQINKIFIQTKNLTGPFVILREQQRPKDLSRRTNQDFSQNKNFLSSVARISNDIIKKAKIRGEIAFSFIKQLDRYKRFLVVLNESVIQKISQSPIFPRFSHFSITLNPSNLLRTGFEKDLLQEIKFFARRAQNDLHVWQSSNNRKIAQMDNKLVQIKTQALAQISKGSHEQLAQLSIDFSFIKKPFIGLKSFIAMRWGIGGKITELEQKVAKLEEKPTELAQNQEGVVVIPSTKDDEENKKKIKSAFSDEVTIEPDETGKSGIIRPIFRKVSDQKYLYVLVPMTDE